MLNVKVFGFFGLRRNPTFAHFFFTFLSSFCAIQTDNIISTGWIAHTFRQAYMNLSKSKVALFKIEAHKFKAPSLSIYLSISLSLSFSVFHFLNLLLWMLVGRWALAQACSGSDVDISSGGWCLLLILGWVCLG